MLDTKRLGAALRRLRVQRGCTRAQLARRLKVDAYYLRGWERGEPMQLHKLGEVLDALQCNLCDVELALAVADAGVAEEDELEAAAREFIGEAQLRDPCPSMLGDAARCGRALRWLREARGQSLRELAERTGMKLQQISVYEKASSRPMVGKLVELLTALGAGLGDLHEALILTAAQPPSQDWQRSELDELRLALLGLGHARPSARQEERLFEILDDCRQQLDASVARRRADEDA